jgi:hypothetical protein
MCDFPLPRPSSIDWVHLIHRLDAGNGRRRDLKPERIRSLEVEHQIVPGRRLRRKICALLTVEDAIDGAGRAGGGRSSGHREGTRRWRDLSFVMAHADAWIVLCDSCFV